MLFIIRFIKINFLLESCSQFSFIRAHGVERYCPLLAELGSTALSSLGFCRHLGSQQFITSLPIIVFWSRVIKIHDFKRRGKLKLNVIICNIKAINKTKV